VANREIVGPFPLIYADPPWRYNDARNTGDHRETTGALDHYNDEGLDKLKELEVRSIAATDSVLFCWATFPLLPDALELVGAWGFKYKTAFVWDKKHGAFGNYHDAELLLGATRGKFRTQRIGRPARRWHSRQSRHARGEARPVALGTTARLRTRQGLSPGRG
jgi:MT-A70